MQASAGQVGTGERVVGMPFLSARGLRRLHSPARDPAAAFAQFHAPGPQK